MVDALVSRGPLSIALHAGIGLQLYISGVYAPATCSIDPNHGVTAVGYGTAGTVDYWKVKNSWGAGWGQKGYF